MAGESTAIITVVKHAADACAACVAFATIMHWMPAIAALLAAIWSTIQIIDWVQKKRASVK